MRTRAVQDGEQFVLNGSKAFITNAGVSEVAVVMAVTDPTRGNKGISAFILDRGTPGFSAGKPYRKLGLHASNTAELHFDNVRVPATALCGPRDLGFVNFRFDLLNAAGTPVMRLTTHMMFRRRHEGAPP